MIRTIQIVFDGPPSHEMPRFVEVEDGQGRSISVGEWKERADGKWALVLQAKLDQAGRAGKRTEVPIDAPDPA
jgi:hypothetical protein